MGKRMTATEKWDKAWFRKLSPRHKSFWQFLTDRCDQAGMWEVDYESASHFINDVTPIVEDDLKVFGARVEKFGPDKVWIVDFISFQCGELSEKSPAHRPIFKLLKKYNLLNRVIRTLSNRVLEIEKEMDKEKEEEKETTDPAKITGAGFSYVFDSYPDGRTAFEEIKADELFVEKVCRIARNKGFVTYTDIQVMKAIKHFITIEEAKPDFDRRPRDEIRKHLVNWINSTAKKIADYG